MKEIVESTLTKLIHYCEQVEYKGYDPYDIQNSYLPINRLPHFFQFSLTQVNKRSPFNIRPLLGVQKEYHTKAMALFLNAYCNLYNLKGDSKYLKKAEFFIEWIKNNKSDLSENVAWGFDYDYTSRTKTVKKGVPTVVHHSYILQALYKYWLITRDKHVYSLILKSKEFILNDIPITKIGENICFGYHVGSIGCCYNASLHAAESLAIVDSISNSNEHYGLIEKAVKYVLSRQKPTGEWYYSHGDDTEIEKKQIDFHQGFILECLKNINDLTNKKLTSIIVPSLKRGLEFYYFNQFDERGRGVFRYPQKYPVDVHNQAQGIITFSKFTDYNAKYIKMAELILQWTIANMQDPRGYFYYQKYPYITNKTSHIRWGQAWMFYALSVFLKNS